MKRYCLKLHDVQCHLIEHSLNKVLFSHPQQVDFPAGEVTFHVHLPNEQGHQLVGKLRQAYNSPRQAKFESCLFEGQAGIQVL